MKRASMPKRRDRRVSKTRSPYFKYHKEPYHYNFPTGAEAVKHREALNAKKALLNPELFQPFTEEPLLKPGTARKRRHLERGQGRRLEEGWAQGPE